MRVLNVVGARPQFIKMAPVHRALSAGARSAKHSIEEIVVHTGQHYDDRMSDIFFRELKLPVPDINLGVGSDTHGRQTGRMLSELDACMADTAPDFVVVYGDTNSTLAAALAAVKQDIPVAHVEAGLRSFDRGMPEEVNRVVADHVSDLLFAPTTTAMNNLRNEHLEDRSQQTGDVMLDAVNFNAGLAREESGILEEMALQAGEFAVATVHRASNTDTERLGELLDAINEIASRHIPLVFPIHPRTRAKVRTSFSEWKPHASVTIIEPIGYLDMLRLSEAARFVLTDSGGLQKEAFFLKTPCVTLRDVTEWPETVEGMGNVLAGSRKDAIISAVNNLMNDPMQTAVGEPERFFGDGRAAEKIVDAMLSYWENGRDMDQTASRAKND